ncbi:MAG: NAD-dependent protein deacylase [Syntrophomonadaceae bacterium]|nr:NAD-dependent protein deacylase [Syntrophomonadaceae bacterium]
MGYPESLQKLADYLKNARRAIALTGAGISTESGIPDFRSPGGLWSDPGLMETLSRRTLARNPALFYRQGFSLFFPVLEAKPNPAHEVLAWLEQQGYITGVVTQNIDGLHQKAGSRRVFEVHGHMRSGTCMECTEVYPMEYIRAAVEQERPPSCECGGYIRPDVTLFGDPMPHQFWQSVEEAKKCDFMLVVGSSLEVSPANTLPQYVDRVAIVNLGRTSYDRQADLIINEKASKVMLELKSLLQKNS